MQNGINYCKELFNEYNTTYNKINTDVWVNIVRSKNPIQIHFKHNDLKGIDKYHTHTEINKNNKKFYPHYTYVYYIQMPDIMEGEDGVLYFKGQNDNEYWIRPEEDDLIIMPGFMPHAPNNAPKSTVDRIVIAGNVGFEYIKKEKSVL
jgi:cupin superfamily acireductone dioxygenase involved in methionine salvage